MQILSDQPQKVDFSHYRSILRNSAVIDDIEKQVNAFQPKKYDVQRQIKAIEAFEAQAVKSAEETKSRVDAELTDLEKTLKNIETARPFEDLTVVRTGRAIWRWRRFVFCSANSNIRTRSWLPARTSTSVLRSSCQRAAGKYPATRRSSATFQCYSRLFGM